MARRVEIRIGGYGGQGVILCGYVIGKAAAICEKGHSTMVQSFGPEARGSACASGVVVSDEQVDYPYLRRPGILVAISQEAYRIYKSELADDGVLLYEADLVNPDDVPGVKAYGVPATRIAEQVVGKRIVVNMVMIGFFAAMTSLMKPESLREAVRTSVPAG
ncbi:2-oxoacid:acceptor oxidoreductase family protein, partial [Planctomycetota bacterium]